MKYILLILTVATLFTSCDKSGPFERKLNCPPYDPTTLNTWFPYHEDVDYYYKDSMGERQRLLVDTIRYNDGDEEEIGWNCAPATECYPSGSMTAITDKAANGKIGFYVLHYPNQTGEHILLNWNSGNIALVANDNGSLSLDPDYDSDDYSRKIKPIFTHYSEILLNEVAYYDVYKIVLNEPDMGTTRTLYLVKSHGIIGYETLAGRTYWLER